MKHKMMAGEAVTIESTYPGVFIEDSPSKGFPKYSLVLCILPETMFDPASEEPPTTEQKNWAGMVAYLWKDLWR